MLQMPAPLQRYAGDILDVDTHEMMPVQAWRDEIGDVTQRLADVWLAHKMNYKINPNHPGVPDFQGDVFEVDDNIWRVKGATAPGATKPVRGLRVMDAMGVKRQLMFPTGVGMYGTFLLTLPSDRFAPTIHEGRKEYGRVLVDAYNDWAMKIPATTDRVRPVLPLLGDSVESLLTQLKTMIKAGIRAVQFPATIPPAGLSPAHSALDPVWKLMSDNNVVGTFHVGINGQVYEHSGWDEAPVFDGYPLLEEFKLDPWATANTHVPAQNFIQTLVLGGVFERFSKLRFGTFENTAFWIGPMCDTMDIWHIRSETFLATNDRDSKRLPMLPSEYVKRNIRSSAFDFERVDTYIQRHPLMANVLCFASDYPHVEGGKDPMGNWYDMLEPLGSDVVEKFFVTNAEWVLSD